MKIESINPATGKTIKLYSEMSDAEISSIMERVQDDFLGWRKRSVEERALCLLKVGEILLERKVPYARLMAEEMGKPVAQGYLEVEKCAWVCRYYAERAADFLKDEFIKTEAREAFVSYQPLGIILGIMPWNFPFWQVFRAAVPALMAGNAFVLKHSPNVTACALAIEAVFRDGGFPENLLRTLVMDVPAVEPLIRDRRVKGVTLTGSCRAGMAVAVQAGAQLKKVVLELGGSDPYIILADADIEEAVKKCVIGRMLNGGQSCIAAKRFIVEEPVMETFKNRFVEAMKSYVMGDPLDEDCNLGPMARFDLRDALHSQVERSVKAGAKLVLGGRIPDRAGAYYEPTVLTEVCPGMAVYDEEVFGPVAAIIGARNEREAIRIANDTSFGLGGAVFTKDFEKGRRIARDELEAGLCFVNDFVKSDPRLPFGGIKQSGYGRELGLFGIHEFVNVKTVSVARLLS